MTSPAPGSVPGGGDTGAGGAAPAIPRELLLFLIQLSAALNKTRAYPEGHPVLAAAMDVLVEQLVGILARRPALVIGVAASQLIVDDVATDPSHPVIKDLARKLHHHQVAGLQIGQGVQSDELEDLLRLLAEETWRQGKPLGLAVADWTEPRWAHLGVEPLPLDHLALSDDASARSVERPAEDLWRGLAVAVLGEERTDEPAGSAARASAAAIGSAVRQGAADPTFAATMVDWLVRADEAAVEGGPASRPAQRLESLLEAMGPEALARIVTLGGAPGTRTALVRGAARALPVGAVMRILQAAEDPNHGVSAAMLRILQKLAKYAQGTAVPILPGADSALRGAVNQLMADWEPEVRESGSYRELLDLLSRPANGATEATGPGSGRGAGMSVPESVRLVYMGLELGIAPASVTKAVEALSARSDLRFLLDLHARSRGAGPAADAIHARMADPGFAVPVLMGTGDEALLDELVVELGSDASGPLLEALELAESASKRHWVLAKLGAFGSDLRPALVARLPNKPWYVQRNLLTLLGSLDTLPAGFSVWEYAGHGDARVRREAFKLLLASPQERRLAVVRAAADPDPGIARMGLALAAEECPEELAARLLDLLRSQYREPELRGMAIRLLAHRRTPAVRDWLLGLVLRRTWFGRCRLRPKTPDVVEGLRVLARCWPTHPQAARALRLARASGDPELGEAARLSQRGAP